MLTQPIPNGSTEPKIAHNTKNVTNLAKNKEKRKNDEPEQQSQAVLLKKSLSHGLLSFSLQITCSTPSTA